MDQRDHACAPCGLEIAERAKAAALEEATARDRNQQSEEEKRSEDHADVHGSASLLNGGGGYPSRPPWTCSTCTSSASRSASGSRPARPARPAARTACSRSGSSSQPRSRLR